MEINLPALRELVDAVGGEVSLHGGCLTHGLQEGCSCSYIFDEGHCGGVGQVFVDNGLPIGQGGNDAPTRELARAYLRLLVGAANALPGLLNRIEELESAHG